MDAHTINYKRTSFWLVVPAGLSLLAVACSGNSDEGTNSGNNSTITGGAGNGTGGEGTVESTGGVPGTGGSLGTGGAAGGTGGAPGGTGGGAPTMGNFFQAGAFQGYGYTSVGDAAGGTITELSSGFTSGQGDVCVEGTLALDYASIGALGMNVNQAEGSDTAEAWTPGTDYSGVFVNISKTVETNVRLELSGSDGNSYCADDITTGGVTIPWSSFRTECWGADGTAYDPSTSFSAIQLSAPGDMNQAVSFGYCLSELYPAEASDDPPEGGEYPFGNDPVPSAGCGKALGDLTTGKHYMTSADLERNYNLALPDNYDPNKPYRLVFGMHFLGGSSDVVRNDGWYGLQPLDDEDSTIWVAPHGYTDSSPWRRNDDKDHVYFDELLAHLKVELCIDESRVFSIGWSFGAMFTNALAQTHQDVLRGVAVFSTADFNIYFPENTGEPLAYMGVHGIYDDLTPYDSGQRSKQRFVDNNGCTGPNPPPENTGQGTHVTTDFEGCGNFPVRWATFAGGHIWNAADPGQPTWVPGEVWEFITQF